MNMPENTSVKGLLSQGWPRGVAAAAALMLLSSGALAEEGEVSYVLNDKDKEGVVRGVAAELESRYVFEELGETMAKQLRKKARKGGYDAASDPEALAEELTADLQATSHDKHLRVIYSPEVIDRGQAAEPSASEIAAYLRGARMRNYGFEKVERLEGNVGYLDLRAFMDPSIAGDTAAAAMAFLANSDALIIDLRRNGGGRPEMIQLLSTYLFDGGSVHLNDMYWREGDQTHQFWTLPHVEGRRMPEVDVYVLTSERTFSAAEEFAYNLKALERAKIVGEASGGGAHPGGTVAIDDHFLVWIPMGRSINPITGSNWEGTGVEPDVAVPSDKALDTAWLMALEKRAEGEEDPHLKEALEKKAAELKAQLGERG